MFVSGGLRIALIGGMVSTGSLLLIVGLNGLGSGAPLVPPPQTEIDLRAFEYAASDVPAYDRYLQMIPTHMQSSQEGQQIQRQFFSHAMVQFQDMIRRELESLPAMKKVRNLPKALMKTSSVDSVEKEESGSSEEPRESAMVVSNESDPDASAVDAEFDIEETVDHQFGLDLNPADRQARVKYSGYLDANVAYAGMMQQVELGFSKTFGTTTVSFDHLIQVDSKSMLRMSWNW